MTSSVNVTISADLVTITKEILNGKLHFFAVIRALISEFRKLKI